MATQARVTSTDALESFRTSLIVFINKARTCVDNAGDEVRRTRSWLQNEQMTRWEGEIRRRSRTLDQAQHELRNAEFAGGQQSAVQIRQAAVARAKQALAEAEDKLRRVKKWNQMYDNSADPVVRRLDSFNQFVTHDLPKAVAHLRNVQKALEAYADSGAPLSDAPAAAESAASAEPDAAEPSTEPPAT